MTIQDNDGNSLVITNITPNQRNIYLSVLGKSRMIAQLDPLNRVLKLKRKRDRHLHYKSNSYGFNYHIISNGTLFDCVLLNDEYGSYKIPKEIILKGKFLFFKQQGFEKQIFLPLTEIVKYKI